MTEEKFDFDLVFDPSEEGSAGWFTYYGLMTDFGTPADILIRLDDTRGLSLEERRSRTDRLATEVVKRWNAYKQPA